MALAAAALALAGAAHAQRIDMRSTPHNLARGESIEVKDARQICVFCHTPTDADLTDAARPLWQPSAPEGQAFLMFDDIGQSGQLGNQSVGSQSIACLSCHDSSQAFGVAGGSQDHPFAVPYRGALTPEARQHAREEARRAGRLIHQGQHVRNNEEFREASRGIVDSRPVWWVSKTGPTAQRGRLDVPLFVRMDEEDNTEVPFVECASCHDPHTVRPLFLRTDTTASDLCMTCHVK
jgi:predicted CXXCH cytochrome family protein